MSAETRLTYVEALLSGHRAGAKLLNCTSRSGKLNQNRGIDIVVNATASLKALTPPGHPINVLPGLLRKLLQRASEKSA